MGETPHQLVEEIGQARTHLDDDLSALRRRAREEAGWRLRLWTRPLWIAGAAFFGVLAIGFLIGRATRS